MLRVKKDGRKGKQAGFVQTAELLLITTVLGLGLVSGLTKLRDQTVAELSDTGEAIGAISQTYTVSGTSFATGGTTVATKEGFDFDDATDNGTGQVGGDLATIAYTAANLAE